MDWRTPAGILAVLAVVGLTLGALASVLTANDLLTGTATSTAAMATLGLAAVAFVVAIALARPSRDWVANPYW